MKEMKRVISLLLCFVMLIGVLPIGALAADSGTTSKLMFATDRHGNSNIIGQVLSKIGSDVEYVGLGGDMVNNQANYSTSTVQGEVTAVATDAVVNITQGSHDSNANDDAKILCDQSGLMYEGGDYYVYGVTQADMESASDAQTAAAAFVTWANGNDVDNSKVIIVLSHMPIHAKRGDNEGAGYWHNALNTVATGSASGDSTVERDVIFFHGHNHTVDANEYFYNVGDQMSVESYVSASGLSTYAADEVQVYDSEIAAYDTASGSTATIYYTYATAGYLNENSDATLVEIDDTTITLTKYRTDSSDVLGTVKRVANETEPEETTTPTTEPEETTTPTTEPEETTTPTTEPEETTAPATSAEGVTCEKISNFSATVLESDSVATAMKDKGLTDYVAYDMTGTLVEGAVVKVTVPSAWGEGNYFVYYVSADGNTVEEVKCEYANGVVTFSPEHFSTYVVGYAETETEVTVPDPSVAENVAGTTTTTQSKEVYVLVDSISAAGDYLIVDTNSAITSANLLTASSSVSNTPDVTVTTGTNASGDTVTYIESPAAAAIWTADGSSTYTLCNSSTGRYLQYKDSRLTTSSSSPTEWNSGTNTLYRKGRESTTYVYYSSGWTTSSSSKNVYFYQKQTVSFATTTSTTGTYSIAGEDVTKVVVDGTTASLSSTLTFAPTSGTATTTDTSTTATYTVYRDPNNVISGISGNTVTFTGQYGAALVKVSYTVTVNGTNYTVDNYITVTGTEPTYSIEITEAADEKEVIESTIVIKGETAIAAGYELDELVTYTTADGAETITPAEGTVTWKSSNTSIASVDNNGKVTFIGGEGLVQITVYYTYAEGKTVTDTISISVSKSAYTVPSDGTDDFPEYPNEGAIRIDKTAVAVGNFSQTGIAQVELSMTGVPYTTGSEIDVVLMLDMTGSMSANDMIAAEEAAIIFAEQIVKNEDGTYNNNRVAVLAFNSSSSSPFTLWSLGVVTADTWSSFCTAVRTASDKQTGGGTPYDEALEKCKSILAEAKTDGTGDNRQQFCVFMSDGGPTSFKYITNYDAVKAGTATSYTTSSASASGGADQSDSNFATIATYTHEYYSTLMKDAGVTIYTVGTGMTSTANPNGATILSNIASDASKAYLVASSSDTTGLNSVFTNIGLEIKQAATDVTVVDKIDSHYSMNFGLPTNVSKDATGMSEFYIQVVQYTLDANKERTDTYTTLENFTFSSDGTLKSHTVDGNACSDCAHVTVTNGTITKIEGTYFTYYIDDEGSEMLEWKAEKLDTTELALQYFVYLDNSAGVDVGQQVAAGTYPTNEYATITYTNFNGKECQKEFPVPQMTWNGAQVTYVFYLVNENGEPVNRAGKVIPFAEAVYVTDPVTYAVTWNEEEGSENMLAENLFASANVPDVYSLYDTDAYYEIRVYENEETNKNYFIIEGSNSVTSKETTKVFNTKAGTKYDDYGAYSATAGEYTSSKSKTKYQATVTTDIDYANTTVAFAVVWTPELVEDTVVIDFGLDVVIDVTTNDALASGVVGVRTDKPSNVEINKGTYTSAKTTTVTSTDELWTASVESLTSVRFHMNEMGINAPQTFYYESDVNYYSGTTLNTTSMYSSVTVIPATTIYYEDSFVELTTTGAAEWTTVGATVNATQDQDRPGESQISAALDADNNYGYDSAYTAMSQYSLGSASKVTVSSGNAGRAAFTFYGTGFDVISLTSNTTGAIFVKVYSVAEDGNKTEVKSLTVDTYYGYTRNEQGEWVISANIPNSLYQVPVMKVEGLSYGKYYATITATYQSAADHNSVGSYDFYLDAIRIYDPCGSNNETANNAYAADGESWPQYIELRNNIIEAEGVTTDETGKVTFPTDNVLSGAVFIDSSDNNTSVKDYVSYGPNNELYLAAGQSVAFELDQTYANIIADVQIALKVGNGGSVTYKIYDSNKTTADNATAKTLNTATDLYYSIKDLSSGTIVITNTGSSGILSITNIKVTYTQNPYGTSSSSDEVENGDNGIMLTSLYMDEEGATAAVMSLRSVAVEDEETIPETTVPEETEEIETTEPEVEETTPETTEPEETEPEEDSDLSDVVNEIVSKIGDLIGKILKKWFH